MRGLFAFVALSACASDPTPATEPPLDPPPPAGGQQLATDSYHLNPGDEIYMCYTFRSPTDAVGITHVDTISEVGIHHLGVFEAFGREEEEGAHVCNTLLKETWIPIFGTGTGSKELQLPDGVGFVIQPSTQYIVQLHLQNATDAPLDVRAGINLTYDHAPDHLQPAGIFALGNDQFTVPAGATDFQVQETCNPGKPMNVFAVFPHMHKDGTKLEVTQNSGDPFYTIDPWVFGNQPMVPVSKTLTTTDQLHMTCHWDNPSDAAIPFGESSDDEMCFFLLFYYPFDSLDGCID